jgi:hypothetical protein
MGKHSVPSTLVTCPICNVKVKSRGLHAHLRLSHPNVDAMTYLRKRIISRTKANERVVFQVSQKTNGELILKWANFRYDDLELLRDVLDVWIEKGHPDYHPGYVSPEEKEQGLVGAFEIDEDSDEDLLEEEDED